MGSKWVRDFEGNFTVVESIQNTCVEAMRLWGYEFVTMNGLTMYNKSVGASAQYLYFLILIFGT